MSTYNELLDNIDNTTDKTRQWKEDIGKVMIEAMTSYRDLYTHEKMLGMIKEHFWSLISTFNLDDDHCLNEADSDGKWEPMDLEYWELAIEAAKDLINRKIRGEE